MYAVQNARYNLARLSKNQIKTKIRLKETFDSLEEIKDILNTQEEKSNFFLFNSQNVVDQHRRFVQNMPRVKPFYAVKCNNDSNFLSFLTKLNMSFDCASLQEIKSVSELGVHPDNIIFANPCKAEEHIIFAREAGVKMMTFDNEDELAKIKEVHPEAELIMRINVDDSNSLCRLNTKFGVHVGMTGPLLRLAKVLNLKFSGVSFHVGSGCNDASSYDDAMKRARRVFDEAYDCGYHPHVLDIGGGFPGYSGVENKVMVEFEEIASTVNESLNRYFPSNSVDVIAEPGRYYAAPAFSLATRIIAKRVIREKGNIKNMYFINDGVYGAFNPLMYDSAFVLGRPNIFKKDLDGVYNLFTDDHSAYDSSIWGPTCDSLDRITAQIDLPDLNIGDWLVFPNMGAYTLTASSEFNGMKRAKIYPK